MGLKKYFEELVVDKFVSDEVVVNGLLEVDDANIDNLSSVGNENNGIRRTVETVYANEVELDGSQDESLVVNEVDESADEFICHVATRGRFSQMALRFGEDDDSRYSWRRIPDNSNNTSQTEMVFMEANEESNVRSTAGFKLIIKNNRADGSTSSHSTFYSFGPPIDQDTRKCAYAGDSGRNGVTPFEFLPLGDETVVFRIMIKEVNWE